MLNLSVLSLRSLVGKIKLLIYRMGLVHRHSSFKQRGRSRLLMMPSSLSSSLEQMDRESVKHIVLDYTGTLTTNGFLKRVISSFQIGHGNWKIE